MFIIYAGAGIVPCPDKLADLIRYVDEYIYSDTAWHYLEAQELARKYMIEAMGQVMAKQNDLWDGRGYVFKLEEDFSLTEVFQTRAETRVTMERES